MQGTTSPQAVVKSRLLKLDGEHIRFVFDCLQRNTTEIRNMKQYLLAVLYNAPVTMENHYASQVNHDLYGKCSVIQYKFLILPCRVGFRTRTWLLHNFCACL